MDSITCDLEGLAEASFRGVPFYVEDDKESYGRRVVTHEYPYRDKPYNEDMGEKAKHFSVKGYVAGNGAKGQKLAIVQACRQKGAAMLQMPAVDGFMAMCLTCDVTRAKDRQGFYQIDMAFVADDGEDQAPAPAGMFESIADGALTNIVGPLADAYSNMFAIENTLQYVADNAVSRLAIFSNEVLSALGATSGGTGTYPGAEISGLPGTSTALVEYANTAKDAPFGLIGSVVPDSAASDARYKAEALSSAVSQLVGLAQNAVDYVQPFAPSRVVPALGDIFYKLSAAVPADDAVTFFKHLSTFAPLQNASVTGDAAIGSLTPSAQLGKTDYETLNQYTVYVDGKPILETVTTGLSPSEAADEKNAQAFNGAVRALAIVAFAKSLTVTQFATRRQALQARADIVELTNQELQRTMDEAVIGVLLDARDNAVRAISNLVVTIIPIVTIEAPITLPSLYWAARLYDDPTRALELSDRNDVSTPAFMPQKFEALAS